MNPDPTLLRAAGASLRRIAGAFALALLAACAALPEHVRRDPSTALADVDHTELAAIAAASTPDDRRHLSGLRLLSDGAEALDARLALARRAQTSIDVQYYLIAPDATGRQFLRALRDAAVRGVRVRLLVDDLHADAPEDLLAGLAAHPNVEVRLFNPLPARDGSRTARVLFSLHEFGRINRRMHNKLFIADHRFALTGGRNVADEYYMRGAGANFIDMDVLASGPVVGELAALFDRFWNSAHAFPIAALMPPPAADARERFDAQVAAAPRAGAGGAIDAQLRGGRVELTFAPVRVYADAPEKAAGAAPQRTAMEHTLDLLRSARSEVQIASPYVIPGRRGLELMREAIDGGVRVSVMTNSLAATDEPLAYWGYSRYREDMLKIGVRLSELSPTQWRKAGRFGEFSSSAGRLHAKLALVDQRWVVIGSMNMDLRSSRLNTEIGLAIDSRELAAEVEQTLHRHRASSLYQLRVAAAGEGIEWIADDDELAVVHSAEPDTDWLLRLRLGLLSMFVAEELL
jgi:cardiolipin synthase C